MLRRAKYVLQGEDASLTLEYIILISIILFISLCALYLLYQLDAMSKVKSGYSTTTGWFRTEDTTGMKN